MRYAFSLLSAAFLAFSCSCTSGPHSNHSNEAREPAGLFNFGAKPLTDQEIKEAAYGGILAPKSARLITDNDAAFDAKVEAIKSAKSGETIRMAYYIFTGDHSSAALIDELLKAARRGVRAKILVDYFTNFKVLDLLSYLEAKSGGMIEVRLWGKPTDNMIRDFQYLAYPCPETNGKVGRNTCADWKENELKGRSPDWYAKLFWVGMYGRDVQALTTAVLTGGLLDLNSFKQGGSDKNQQKKLLDFLKLVYAAKIKNDPVAAVKVMLAYQFYGDDLDPVMNQIYGRLPIKHMAETSFQDWEHFTDFIHHKMILVGDRYLQIGGRNIENSYHMKANPLIARYVFMDTDFAVDIASGGQNVVQSYEDIWNFSPMVATVRDVQKNLPYDFIMNAAAVKKAGEACRRDAVKTLQQREAFSTCMATQIPKQVEYRDLFARQVEIEKSLTENARRYVAEYLPNKRHDQTWKKSATYRDELESADLSRALITYIENVPYLRSKPLEKRERKVGNETGKELKYGHSIHHLWIRGMENTCAMAAAERKKNPNAPEKRIILHSAYFIPPAAFLRTFGKMLDGTWDCRGVRVTFLTNSFETTDLNYINVVARYEMLAFFRMYENRRAEFGEFAYNRGAKFEYYEYLKSPIAEGLSLHTKLSVLGDDMIVGSANADVRTYYMDTNNGVFIRGAPGLVREYTEWIDSLLRDSTVTKDLTDLYSKGQLTRAILYKQDEALFEALMKRWKSGGEKLSPETKAQILEHVRKIADFVFEASQKILNKSYIQVPGGSGGSANNDDSLRQYEQEKLEKMFNRALQIL
jgi:phosphatidylserine/phosphatidylglycerophosphate/cardiolipin synthase-like enzyme